MSVMNETPGEEESGVSKEDEFKNVISLHFGIKTVPFHLLDESRRILVRRIPITEFMMAEPDRFGEMLEAMGVIQKDWVVVASVDQDILEYTVIDSETDSPIFHFAVSP